MNEIILQLRNDYRACIKLANETDSKSIDASLKKEASMLLGQLRSSCKHEDSIVVLRSEYEGSRSWDYDNAHPEDRICLCCGIGESAYHSDKFKKLQSLPIARFENNCPDQVKKPLTYLLSEVQDLARSKGYVYFGWKEKEL